MKGQFGKSLYSLMITLLCLGSLLTTVTWYMVENNDVKTHRPPHKKGAPRLSDLCKRCRELIDKVNERYSKTWERQEDNYQQFRSALSNKCHGFDQAIITQANSPVGSKILYEQKGKILQVTPELFSIFAKEHPFQNKTWDTCAVVGNGGILGDSGCGKMIDSAQFVFRCNLPPLENGYENDVGIKTDLVTANPSIFDRKFGALMGRRRPFVESLRSYGNSLLLLPAFSYSHTTSVCLRAAYATEDLKSPIRPVFFNPQYLQSLKEFWRSKNLREMRLSTGMMIVSMALEVCSTVNLYGFWPFANHPHGLYTLTNHYYDDMKVKSSVHAMPAEFDFLMRLHSQGVLRLHLGDCRPGGK